MAWVAGAAAIVGAGGSVYYGRKQNKMARKTYKLSKKAIDDAAIEAAADKAALLKEKKRQ